jgi:excisionase family DNA binding protein
MSQHVITSGVARYLRVVPAARYAGVSADTIRRWIEIGRLRAYRPGGVIVLVEVAELDRLLQGPAVVK